MWSVVVEVGTQMAGLTQAVERMLVQVFVRCPKAIAKQSAESGTSCHLGFRQTRSALVCPVQYGANQLAVFLPLQDRTRSEFGAVVHMPTFAYQHDM